MPDQRQNQQNRDYAMSEKKATTANKEKTDHKPLVDGLEAFAAQPPTVKNALKFPDIPPKDYDLDVIDDFLNRVFHTELNPEENILTWMVKPTKSPAYPKTDEKLFSLLEATRQPKALYYATATCKQDDDGKLYHRKKLFTSLRVVVLDDIGTKVPVEKIPTDFPPSYIIESSAGNFQYGYILDEPIYTLAAAEALIQLVYESGYSDEGGKTPVKLVRLPEGVNGKKGDKGSFVSTLTSLTNTRYSPQQILDALKLNVKWEEVLEDADDVTKRRASKSLGTSPWADVTPQAQAMNGFIDPVLEWLYETNQVEHDTDGEWLDILCPWAENHTSGNSTARYAPIGRGEDVNSRAFHCHHDHCASLHTNDFLAYVAATGGIQAGVRDPSAQLASQYVFDKTCNSVWDIKSDKRDLRIGMQSFITLHPHKAAVNTIAGGKPKFIGMANLWSTSPARVVVAGATYDPSTTARIVQQQGEKFVNLFSIPDWGHGPIDMTHVDTFKDYLSYLIPDKEARDYFLMWLAAKCQDMSFRGAAIVMVAQKQGVGRSTMADMIKTLVGAGNVADVPLNTMIGESAFNEWQEKPFIVSEETLAGDPSKFYNTYEKLKTYIDPRSRTITINPKFGVKREVECHSSYLFLTNHENAIAIPEEDRRFFVLDNAFTPAAPSVFTKLNNWLKEEDSDGLPTWGRHVFRWLQTLEVDIEKLTSPPPRSDAKTAMTHAAMNNLDFATKVLLEIWPDPYISGTEAFKVFENPLLSGPLRFDEDTNRKFVKMMVNRNSVAYKTQAINKDIKGLEGRVRPRLNGQAQIDGKEFVSLDLDPKKQRPLLQEHYYSRKMDYAKLAEKILIALGEDDRV